MDASWAVGASSTNGSRFILFKLALRRKNEKKCSQMGQTNTPQKIKFVDRIEARVTKKRGKGLTPWQQEATSKTIRSHTNHQRAYCSANYCTSQSQENARNQHWMCLCWGNIRRTPLSFLISSFLSLVSLFHVPFLYLFPFSCPPSHQSLFSFCKYRTVYALRFCKRTITVTEFLLCGVHGKLLEANFLHEVMKIVLIEWLGFPQYVVAE